MAWNEPGGGGNKNDPWGGKKDQGPPDLDEAFKKLQEKLNGMFGGGGGSNTSPSINGSFILLVLMLLVAVWAGFGVYQVDEKDRVVVLRFGKFLETTGPGLHWNPVIIDTKIVVTVTEERQYESRGLMLTQDENIVESPLTVQWNVADPKAFALNVRNPELSLRHATDSALRHVVGSSKLDEVVSVGRERIGVDVELRLQQYLDSYETGINVIKINIQEAKPPVEVKEAYDDVIKAREDQERLVNEAQAYANGVIPESRGKAQRLIEEANGYKVKVTVEAEGEAARFENLLAEYQKAPGVTRERLYLDAVEGVMSASSKVLVDIEGGNNMLYLPLDKMTSARSSVGSGASISEIADEVIKKLRREQGSSSTTRRGGAR